MLDVKLFSAYGDLYLRTDRYDAMMRKVLAGIKSVQSRVDIAVNVDRSRATATLNLLKQQADAIRRGTGGTIAFSGDLTRWNASVNRIFIDLGRIHQLARIPIGAAGPGTIPAAVAAAAGVAGRRPRAAAAAPAAAAGTGFAGINVASPTAAAASGRFARLRGALGAGGPGFLTGASQGLGMPFVGNPAALAGMLTVGGAVATARTAAEYEAAYTTIGRVANLSAGQVKELEGRLDAIATSSGTATSLRDMVTMADLGARAGISDKGGVAGLAEFVRGMAQIKTIISDVPVEQLASDTAKVLNNFQLGTEYTVGFGSALAALDASTQASASEILDLTMRLAGSGRAAGGTIQEMMALAATMKQVGIGTEVGGTAFSQLFMKMATDSEDFARVVGVSTREFEDAYRKGPIDALKLVIDKINSMDDTIAKSKALDELGLEGARVVGSLLRMGSVFDQVGPRVAQAAAEFTTGKAALHGVAAEAGTVESSVTRLGSAFAVAGKNLGHIYSPVVKGVLDTLTDVVGASGHLLAGGLLGTNRVSFAGGPEAAPGLPALPGRPTSTAEPKTFDEAQAAFADAMGRERAAMEEEIRTGAALKQARIELNAALVRQGNGVIGAEREVVAATNRFAAAEDAAAAATARVATVSADVVATGKKMAQVEARAAAVAERKLLGAPEDVAATEAWIKAQDEARRRAEEGPFRSPFAGIAGIAGAVGAARGALSGPLSTARGALASGARQDLLSTLFGGGAGGTLLGGGASFLKHALQAADEAGSKGKLAVGLSGGDVLRRMQEDALNQPKDDSAAKTAVNTADAVKVLNDVLGVLRNGPAGGPAVL